VLGQLRAQRPFDQRAGQLLEQAVRAGEVFGALVVGQQFVEQLLGVPRVWWTGLAS
jgi:hypothetical protein